ncbi:MAG TPA: two pore domain potassium channel family protein, partial [Candidatus Dormibacteraeota bacterium]|nr:two pore domain potassium channel family protein [Candidatus Dormibacteraeota bacterium]
MQVLVALLGILAVAVVLRDAFETIILPRRVSARLRVSKIFYQATWRPWRAVGRRLHASDWRETYLSTYGP